MMFSGWDYITSPGILSNGDYYLEEESFLDHYEDEIEDRAIPALDSDEVAVQQLTLFGGAY